MVCKKCGCDFSEDMACCPVCGMPREYSQVTAQRSKVDLSKAERSETSPPEIKKTEVDSENTVGTDNSAGNTQKGSACGVNKEQSAFGDYGNNTAASDSKAPSEPIKENPGAGQTGQNYIYGNQQGTAQGHFMNEPQGFDNSQWNMPAPKKKNTGTIVLIIAVVLIAAGTFIFGGFMICSGFSSTIESMVNLSSDIMDDYNDGDFDLGDYDFDFSLNDDSTEDSLYEEDSDLDYYKGTINGMRYENQFFGLAYDIPYSYYIYSEEEIEDYYGFNGSLEYGVFGLDVIDDTVNELVIYIMRSGTVSPEKYIDNFVSSYSQYYESGTFIADQENKAETIAGIDFIGRTIEALEYDPEEDYKYVSIYLAEKDGILIMIQCHYDEPLQKERMFANFETL